VRKSTLSQKEQTVNTNYRFTVKDNRQFSRSSGKLSVIGRWIESRKATITMLFVDISVFAEYFSSGKWSSCDTSMIPGLSWILHIAIKVWWENLI